MLPIDKTLNNLQLHV